VKIYESDDGAGAGHASHPVRRLGRAWPSRHGGKGAHARSPAPVGRRGHDKGPPPGGVPGAAVHRPPASRAGRGVGFLLAPLRMLCPGHCSSRLCPRSWRVQAGVHRQKAQLRRVGVRSRSGAQHHPQRKSRVSFRFISFFSALPAFVFQTTHTGRQRACKCASPVR
jgi:hypothetical protein